MNHYTIISGTGRAGTTLLMRILTRAGLDTGIDLARASIDPIAHAGLEFDIRNKPNCAIVKSPWIATYVEEVLADSEITIDHAIVCTRNLFDAAESRRRIQRLNQTDVSVPGGLWGTSEPCDQEPYLAHMFYRLIFHLTEHDVPITFLHFPRFAIDPDYLIARLPAAFPNCDPERLLSAHGLEAAPELISDFRLHRMNRTMQQAEDGHHGRPHRDMPQVAGSLRRP